jgi:glycosyltransferase A (GT-A) superfamily protein (DUF2064 family)
MNREIVIGFLKEHEKNCQHTSVSSYLNNKHTCDFCHQLNRDTPCLLSNINGARTTIDVGLALTSLATQAPYRPFKMAGFELLVQSGSSETESVRRLFNEAFIKGYERVIILSHSVPNLPPFYLEEAFSILRDESGLVAGPLENGTFYLIGMTRVTFKKLNWNSVFEHFRFEDGSNKSATIQLLKKYCKNCSFLPQWYLQKDIDDLKKLYHHSQQGVGWKSRWTQQFANLILS